VSEGERERERERGREGERERGKEGERGIYRIELHTPKTSRRRLLCKKGKTF
jgi:hypothetical protein